MEAGADCRTDCVCATLAFCWLRLMLVNFFRRLAPKSKRAFDWREKTLVEAARLREAGDMTGAIEKLHQVLEREPGELRALNDLGACFAYVGRAHDAERVFELAYSQDD